MKYWRIDYKWKENKDWSHFGDRKDSISAIKKAKELITRTKTLKVKVTEIEENIIYEEEAD